MGAYCSSGDTQSLQYGEFQIHISLWKVIKLQAAVRGFLARRKLQTVRQQKVKEIVKSSSADTSKLFVNNTPSQSFEYSERQIEMELVQKLKDGTKRVYIDTFEDRDKSGIKYRGHWSIQTKKKDGLGIQLYPDGARYEGLFQDGLFHGLGKMTQANGDVYMGQWQLDKATGWGAFFDAAQGVRYTGQWINDAQHGQGEEVWDNEGRTRYTGQFYKGKKQGHGVFEWADGSYFEGEFMDGQFQGHGKYYFADADKSYEGEFRMGKIEGRGVETWKDGRRYEGEFKNGKKDGDGTFTWSNGTMYIGSWRDDKQHGIGIFINPKEKTLAEQKKHGEWVNGKRVRWIQSQPSKF